MPPEAGDRKKAGAKGWEQLWGFSAGQADNQIRRQSYMAHSQAGRYGVIAEAPRHNSRTPASDYFAFFLAGLNIWMRPSGASTRRATISSPVHCRLHLGLQLRPQAQDLTSYEFICKAWDAQRERFKLGPLQQCRD